MFKPVHHTTEVGVRCLIADGVCRVAHPVKGRLERSRCAVAKPVAGGGAAMFGLQDRDVTAVGAPPASRLALLSEVAAILLV